MISPDGTITDWAEVTRHLDAALTGADRLPLLREPPV